MAGDAIFLVFSERFHDMPRQGTYVDNASNRAIGRVGLSYGTASCSTASSGYSSGGGYSQ